MKQIQLTQGQFTLVDDEDFKRVFPWKWYAWWCPSTKSFYAVRMTRRDRNRKQTRILMHRFIMNAQPEQWVDHINFNTLNNTKGNLRVCTPNQSSYNRRKYSNNKSGVLGVCWSKVMKLWEAQIQYNGKKLHLGFFESIKEAKKVRDEAAIRLHGKFASIRNTRSNTK